MSGLKTLARDWLPPALVRWWHHICGRRSRYEGDFGTWAEVGSQCTGYSSDEIFQRVREASLKVKRGEALFERDSICFTHEEYRWEVLACLMLGAAKRGGALNVLDFGGALGSFYAQHKRLFSGLGEQRWGIVEQKHYVECGRREFETDQLKFFFSVDECSESMPVNVILLSSVLQYLERPYDHLTKLAEQNADYIIIDRTPFIDGVEDRVVIQRVPKFIYPASYPMWTFSAKHFERTMNGLGYYREAHFPSPEGRIGKIDFLGMLFRRDAQ